MSITTGFAEALQGLIFNGTAVPGVAQNVVSAPLASLYMSLLLVDPGPDATQSTAEVSYTGYSRVAVSRDGTAWSVSGAVATLLTAVDFGKCMAVAGTPVVTCVGLGTAASGAGELLFRLPLQAAPIRIFLGTTPRIGAGTSLTVLTE